MTRALSELRDNLPQETAQPYRADSLGIPRTTDPHTARGERPDPTVAPVRPNAKATRWGLSHTDV